MTDDEIIAVVMAIQNKKPIQCICHDGTFMDVIPERTDMLRVVDLVRGNIRVKPEPRKPREWICSVVSGQLFTNYTISTVNDPCVEKKVRVREVIEDDNYKFCS